MLSGQPGIGKTALLLAALERADDMTVLRVRGLEAEAEQPFAGLAELCGPVLGLLALAAEERPVVCVVDDLQWLDEPSLEALRFATRRAWRSWSPRGSRTARPRRRCS